MSILRMRSISQNPPDTRPSQVQPKSILHIFPKVFFGRLRCSLPYHPSWSTQLTGEHDRRRKSWPMGASRQKICWLRSNCYLRSHRIGLQRGKIYLAQLLGYFFKVFVTYSTQHPLDHPEHQTVILRLSCWASEGFLKDKHFKISIP